MKKNKRNKIKQYTKNNSFFANILRILNKKLTFMFVPHSRKRSLTLGIRLYALLALLISVGSLTILSVYILTSRSVVIRRLQDMTAEYEKRKNDLEIYQKSISVLGETVDHKDVFTDVLSKSGVNVKEKNIFSNVQNETGLEYISAMVKEIEASKKYFADIISRAETRKKIYENIPNIMPVRKEMLILEIPYKKKNVKGVLIEALPSTPIRASANAEIISIKYNKEYGYEVILKHHYDVTTIYRGIGNLKIDITDKRINKGEVLGYLNGNVFKKRYLEYEMIFANTYVDPNTITINLK